MSLKYSTQLHRQATLIILGALFVGGCGPPEKATSGTEARLQRSIRFEIDQLLVTESLLLKGLHARILSKLISASSSSLTIPSVAAVHVSVRSKQYAQIGVHYMSKEPIVDAVRISRSGLGTAVVLPVPDDLRKEHVYDAKKIVVFVLMFDTRGSSKLQELLALGDLISGAAPPPGDLVVSLVKENAVCSSSDEMDVVWQVRDAAGSRIWDPLAPGWKRVVNVHPSEKPSHKGD